MIYSKLLESGSIWFENDSNDVLIENRCGGFIFMAHQGKAVSDGSSAYTVNRETDTNLSLEAGLQLLQENDVNDD